MMHFVILVIKMNGIILAAGFGKRLKPITNTIPKPLLPIINRPIIEINVECLKRAGIKKIGINLYYKKEEVASYLGNLPHKLSIILEDRLSGTGGALLNFKGFINGDFIIHNCDVISNINLASVIKFHQKNRPLATLVLTKNKGTNRVEIYKNRIINIFKFNKKSYFTYTGIAILSKRIFNYFPLQKKNFSIIEVYKKAIRAGEKILGFPISNTWYDIGSYASYWQMHQDILYKKVKLKGIKIHSPIYIHPSSIVATKKLKGFVCIGSNCYIAKNVALKNTLVFPNTEIIKGNYINTLLSNKFCINVPC